MQQIKFFNGSFFQSGRDVANSSGQNSQFQQGRKMWLSMLYYIFHTKNDASVKNVHTPYFLHIRQFFHISSVLQNCKNWHVFGHTVCAALCINVKWQKISLQVTFTYSLEANFQTTKILGTWKITNCLQKQRLIGKVGFKQS